MVKRIGMVLGGLLMLGIPAAAAETFSDAELSAVLPYDLGPAQVDVSKYPAEQQAYYKTFQQRCSLCHTPARALNFPLVEREDWMRFIMRMHGRAHGTLVDEKEAQAIANFLAFDSNERKVKQAEAYAQQQTQLDQKFERIKAERARRLKACTK